MDFIAQILETKAFDNLKLEEMLLVIKAEISKLDKKHMRILQLQKKIDTRANYASWLRIDNTKLSIRNRRQKLVILAYELSTK